MVIFAGSSPPCKQPLSDPKGVMPRRLSAYFARQSQFYTMDMLRQVLGAASAGDRSFNWLIDYRINLIMQVSAQTIKVDRPAAIQLWEHWSDKICDCNYLPSLGDNLAPIAADVRSCYGLPCHVDTSRKTTRPESTSASNYYTRNGEAANLERCATFEALGP